MSMHRIPLTPVEEAGLRAHGLDVGTPSQLSDVFRQGVAWGQDDLRRQLAEAQARLAELEIDDGKVESLLKCIYGTCGSIETLLPKVDGDRTIDVCSLLVVYSALNQIKVCVKIAQSETAASPTMPLVIDEVPKWAK